MNSAAKAKMRSKFPGAPEWLVNDEGLRQQFTQLAIHYNRFNGYLDPDHKACEEYGYAGTDEYWSDILAEPMKASSFINLMNFHFVQFENQWKGPVRALEKALDLAQSMQEVWFFKGHEALMVYPRAAAEWLLSMPKRRHLIPPTLASYLQGDEPSKSEVAHDPPKHVSRRRGRPPNKSATVIAAMQAAIVNEVMSVDDLRNKAEKDLEAMFGASRDTCRKARDKVLSENVENSFSTNIPQTTNSDTN